MNDNGGTRIEENSQPLTRWIESVLFGMNLLLTLLGTVLILRFRTVTLKVFQDFDIKMTEMLEIVLSLPFAGLLPTLGLAAVAVRFLVKNERHQLTFHIAHLLSILLIAFIFVGTTLPALHRLLDQL